MIQVENLTKRYTGQTAISELSFNVGAGEIVGLLGPNGAGKTTTMRILAGYMPASSGAARIGGLDVFYHSRQVRERIGYMPENNPLYPEMRVKEYLKFRARLKGVRGKQVRSRLNAVLEQCHLKEVSRKIIGQLSKGYRQRVGLADALIHKPDLLILDEPTLGLDPNQIRSVRQLIKDLAGAHTILLSTHILPEVEMTSDRVLILDQGKIRAADTTENLQTLISGGGQVIAELAAPEAALREFLENAPDAEQYDLSPLDGEFFRCAITPRAGADLRSMVYNEARARDWELRELTRSRYSLEDIFVHLTREEPEAESEE